MRNLSIVLIIDQLNFVQFWSDLFENAKMLNGVISGLTSFTAPCNTILLQLSLWVCVCVWGGLRLCVLLSYTHTHTHTHSFSLNLSLYLSVIFISVNTLCMDIFSSFCPSLYGWVGYFSVSLTLYFFRTLFLSISLSLSLTLSLCKNCASQNRRELMDCECEWPILPIRLLMCFASLHL